MFDNHAEYKDKFKNFWPKTKDLLSRSIALPVMVSWSEEDVDNYYSKLKDCFKCVEASI